MKNNLLLIVILFNLNLFGQSESTLKYEKEYFENAEQALKNSKGLEALYYYHWVCFLDSNTNIEDISRKKIDSLFPIYQKKEIKKWNGIWKLKQLKTNLFNYTKIKVTEDEISFFDSENDTIASRVEKIKPTKYDPNEIDFNTSTVKFKNNEIWEFRIKKVNDELRLFPKLKTDSTGVSWITADDRGIIKDSVEREKALAEEIRTFYIPEK